MSLIKWEEVTDDFEQVFDVLPAIPFSKMSHDLYMGNYKQDDVGKPKALVGDKHLKTRYR